MLVFQDCYNKNYTVNFYIYYILIVINNIPKDSYNLDKLYYDLEPYFMIDNTIIKYNGKILYTPKQLKTFLNIIKNHLQPLNIKNI